MEKSQMLGKYDKMSSREAMFDLVGWKPSHGEQPRFFNAVSDALGISARMARSIWEGSISDDEHLAIKALKRQAEETKTRREAQRDARIVADFFNRRAQALSVVDEEFHRHEIDAFREAARAVCRTDRT